MTPLPALMDELDQLEAELWTERFRRKAAMEVLAQGAGMPVGVMESIAALPDEARKKIVNMTTRELRISSPRLGHDTLFISASTEIRKSANAGTFTTR